MCPRPLATVSTPSIKGDGGDIIIQICGCARATHKLRQTAKKIMADILEKSLIRNPELPRIADLAAVVEELEQVLHSTTAPHPQSATYR